MKNIKNILTALFLPLAAAGCIWLPAGDPPAGNIVENQYGKSKMLSRVEAVEHFINILTTASLEHCPGGKIFIDADDATAAQSIEAVRKAGELSGITTASSPENNIRLRSRYDEKKKIWQMELSRNGKIFWQDNIFLKQQEL